MYVTLTIIIIIVIVVVVIVIHHYYHHHHYQEVKFMINQNFIFLNLLKSNMEVLKIKKLVCLNILSILYF